MGIAAMAALTLVSCSSDDLNSLSDNSSKNEAISFDGYLGRSAVAVNGSRGSELTKEKLKTDGFGVFGNYSEDSEETATAYGNNWFDNQPVTYKTSAWTYEPLKYWLPKGHIDFLAYAPYVKGTTLNNTSIDFTVEGDVANQKDLLWANATNKTKTDKIVTFKFNHALAKIGYTVKTNVVGTFTTITLNKITLAGSEDGTTKTAFYKKGTIDLSYTSSSTTASLWNTSSSDKQNFTWFSGNQKLTDKVADNTNYLFVIPQDFSATATDKLYVIVDYTINYNTGVQMKNTVRKKLEKDFEQGKEYKINLSIGLTPIEFEADVTSWADGGKEDITWE